MIEVRILQSHIYYSPMCYRDVVLPAVPRVGERVAIRNPHDSYKVSRVLHVVGESRPRVYLKDTDDLSVAGSERLFVKHMQEQGWSIDE